MRGRLERTLARLFRRQFAEFPAEWVALAVEMIEAQAEVISSDVARKYRPPNLEADLEDRLVDAIEFDSALFGMLLYRIMHGIFRQNPNHPALPYFSKLMSLQGRFKISASAEIGPHFSVMHGAGVCIGAGVRIGRNFTIYQDACLEPRGRMTIGDHCIISTGAKVLGGLTIGDHVKIAANAVLLTDAESHSTYAGIPAIKVRAAVPA